MEPTFRASMSWLHTWAGVALGSVLLVVFWMGSMAVFDREIDRWMMPATRLAPPPERAWDPLLLDRIAALPAGTATAYAVLPGERDPSLLFAWRAGGAWQTRRIDPTTGAELPDAGTLGGSRFLYPFHYSLHLHAASIGLWIVCIASMAMLALLVSGVAIHIRIFADFFAFRARGPDQRAKLDLHALSGVAAIPFHAIITLSGLAIFFALYFPGVRDAAYRDDPKAFAPEAYGPTGRTKAGTPAAMYSIDAMIAQARAAWGDGDPGLLWITNPNDANGAVLIRRSGADRVAIDSRPVFFDGPTGARLPRADERSVMGVQRFLSGLHMVQHRHWTIRWLYFLGGLTGCLLIATGFLLWIGARRRKHAAAGHPGTRIVEALAATSSTGLVIATLAFLIANRLLPAGAAAFGFERAGLEILAFAGAWIASLVHAAFAARSAWMHQAWAIAGLALLAAALNWITTGDHPLRAIAPVRGVDLVLIAAAGIAAAAALRLGRARRLREAAARESTDG